VFSLLALELPATPLKVAFRALHSDDRMLRGLALEYLEGSLPHEVFERLVAFLESGPTGPAARPREEVLQELLASQDTITSRLRIPSADAPG
jgi:hypothetical protein